MVPKPREHLIFIFIFLKGSREHFFYEIERMLENCFLNDSESQFPRSAK